jgi:hypothetical protein
MLVLLVVAGHESGVKGTVGYSGKQELTFGELHG